MTEPFSPGLYDEHIRSRLETNPGPKPLDVACPHCSAAIGRGCKTKSSYGAKTHLARWHAVGVKIPSCEDRERDYLSNTLMRLEYKIQALSDNNPPRDLKTP
jgi:hypothetical protein